MLVLKMFLTKPIKNIWIGAILNDRGEIFIQYLIFIFRKPGLYPGFFILNCKNQNITIEALYNLLKQIKYPLPTKSFTVVNYYLYRNL